MKGFLLAACLMFLAVPAAACVPPPGLSLQQWYSTCGRDMEDGFSRGYGGSQSHHEFIMSMYQMYQSSHPTYNPALKAQQDDLARRMTGDHEEYMRGVDEERDRRRDNFDHDMQGKRNAQEDTMMHIQDEHCVEWNANGSCRYKVPN